MADRLFAVDFEAIVTAVQGTVDYVVQGMADRAQALAVDKAPVRRVFRGGRSRKRALTSSELLRMDRQMPTMRISAGMQTVTRRNRNTIIRSAEDVLARQVKPLVRSQGPTFRVGSRGQAIPRDDVAWAREPRGHELNAEGNYAIRNIRLRETASGDLIDVGRGAVNVKTFRDKSSGEITGYGYILGGRLRDSITQVSETAGDIVKRSVVAGGPTAPYARYMEFGTRYVASRPFMRPALKAVEQVYAARMRSALRRAFG